MIRINNKFIPFKNFGCMNVLGFLFVRTDPNNPVVLSNRVIRHEAIHTAQQYEILIVSALLALTLSNVFSNWWMLLISIIMPIAIYIFAWLIELILPPYNSAYKDSPFEREANANENDPEYLANRKLFAWIKYTIKWKER